MSWLLILAHGPSHISKGARGGTTTLKIDTEQH
jgi:hypothetical protein